MRLLLLSLVAPLALACATIPGFEDPKTRVTAYGLFYELSGDTSMQSNAGGPIVNNPSMDLSDFGIRESESAFGARVEVGDGFSGVGLDYLWLDYETTDDGTLTSDWGNLRAGDTVNTRIKMTNARLRWILGQTWLDDDEEWGAGLGGGATLAHRRLRMNSGEVTGLRSQKLEMEDDGAVFLAARGRVSWRGVALTADYAISDDWNFGGEFNGTQQDLEVALAYTLDSQRMTLFVGYQHTEFPGDGDERGLQYTSDFSLEGFYAGLTMIF